MSQDHELRQRITVECQRLWQEAKDWKANGFPCDPIVVRLRDCDATATVTDLIEEPGKAERGLQFRLTWSTDSVEYYVDLFVSIHAEGGPRSFPYGGVRILTGNRSVRTEGDIFWGEFKDESLVNTPLSAFCRRQIERACRHKNENKIFRFKLRS